MVYNLTYLKIKLKQTNKRKKQNCITKLCIITIVTSTQRLFFSLLTVRTWSLILVIFKCCLFTETGSTFLDFIFVDFFAGPSLLIERSKQTNKNNKRNKKTTANKLENSAGSFSPKIFFLKPNSHKVKLYNGYLSNSTSCSSL